MLVCNVSLRPSQSGASGIVADITETAVALDNLGSGSGQVVFAALVDDPASAGEFVDANLGVTIIEAASAVDLPAASIVAAPTGTTWNPADIAQSTLSNGNLTVTTTGNSPGVRGNVGFATGKYYWENTGGHWQGGGSETGLARSTASLVGGALPGQAVVVEAIVDFGAIHINGVYSGSALGTVSTGMTLGIAVDLTAGLIWFRKAPSGNWNNSGTANPATGAGGISLGALAGNTLFPFYAAGAPGEIATANFGATAFIGAVPSGFTSGWV